MEVRRLRMENVTLRETVAMYELSVTLAHTLDFNTILNKTADAVREQCDADEVSIMLPADEGDALRVAVVRGGNRGHLTGKRVSLERGIAGWVARHGEPLTLHGPIDDPRFTPVTPRPDICSAISMPMMAGGTLVGVLNVNAIERRRPFTLGEVKGVNILAGTAAAALENARLYSELRDAEAKYRTIFENTIEGIFQATPEGAFITANPALAEMLGYDSQGRL